MSQIKIVVWEIDGRNIQCPWDDSELVTDFRTFPHGYGTFMNESRTFPEELYLWRMRIDSMQRVTVRWVDHS